VLQGKHFTEIMKVKTILSLSIDDIFNEFQVKTQDVQDKNQAAVYILAFQLFMEHRGALIKIKNAGLDYLLFNQFWGYNKFFLKHIFNGPKKNSELYNEYLIKYQMGGITTIIIEWIKLDMPLPPEKIGEIVYEIAKLFQDQEGYLPDILIKIENKPTS
jgi:hypothetical protein